MSSVSVWSLNLSASRDSHNQLQGLPFPLSFFPPLHNQGSSDVPLISYPAQPSHVLLSLHQDRVDIPDLPLVSSGHQTSTLVVAHFLGEVVTCSSCKAGQKQQLQNPKASLLAHTGSPSRRRGGAPRCPRGRSAGTWVGSAGAYGQRSATMKSGTRTFSSKLGPIHLRFTCITFV